jgi:malonyl-CoA/methylmalonyl-CoA synthetase
MANPLFDSLFARHVQSIRPFLHLDGGDVLTHAAFAEGTARIVRVLHGSGVGPGDRVVLQVAKSAEALMVYAACVRAGAVLVPLNPTYTQAEMDYFIADADPRVVICDPGAVPALPDRVAAFTLDGAGGGSLMTAPDPGGPDGAEPRAGSDLAAILYTSGTTGRSKGAMLTQDNLLSNALVLADLWRFTADDVLLHALPVFHTHGLFVAVNICLASGAAMIFHPRFDAGRVLDDMPRATAMMGVPTFYTRLLEEPRLTRAATTHMRLFVSGSAPLLARTHAEFAKRTGHMILERYGMTETNMNTSNPYDGPRRAGTVGLALPGTEVIVTDPATGHPLPQGETGMVEVRGPNVFAGYWRMPEKTAAELRDNGYFLTGDLGRIDADGYLSIVGRQKDLIIAGGYNIYPKEIEMAIDALPGVVESAVIGLPDPDLGERVVAVVVTDGRAELTAKAIGDAIAPGLARFKQPREIIIAPDLPRNAMGKVQKAALRARLAYVA